MSFHACRIEILKNVNNIQCMLPSLVPLVAERRTHIGRVKVNVPSSSTFATAALLANTPPARC